MPKIVVKKKAEIYKEFQIRPFQNKITIGSEGDNDLVITDKKVSMHHLLIEKEGTKYFITDTDSAFGTHLNGNKIADRTQIMSGDEINIGEHTLLFENILFEKQNENQMGTPNGFQSSSQTLQTLRLPSSNLDTYEISDKIVTEQAHIIDKPYSEKVQYYLIAIYGPYIGKKYHLNSGVTKIGRDKILNDIVIRENAKGEVDSSISRRHATIFYENNNYYISDKRSKTRTYVNRQLLAEDSVVQLNAGDEIEIVSDQKSTIFRLVKEGLWDYSSPQKAGDWWIRNSPKVTKILSGILVLTFLLNIVFTWRKLGIIIQKPSSFIAEEQIWLTENNDMSSLSSPEEIADQIFSLTPLIGEINGDGINDLVYIDKIGYLHAIDGFKHEPLWPVNYKYRIHFPSHVVLADLNGNGLLDIVIPAIDSRIYALDGRTGTEIWSTSLVNGIFSGAPVIVDLNGDKIKDIIFCTKEGEINIGYATYSEPRWGTHQTNSEIMCIPAAGDFNGDGMAEVAIGTENGEVFIFDGISNKFSKIIDINEELQKAKGSFFEDHQIRGHISIGKIDDDNCDDLVITTQQANIIALSGKNFKRIWYDEFITDEPLSSKLMVPAALGDFDGDKKMDVVLFTYDNKIVAYRGLSTGGGQKKVSWGFMPEINEFYIAHPVLADINKDNYCDVIAAGVFGGLYIFNGKNGKILWKHEGTGNLDEAIISTPLIGDLNGNNKLDILIRRANNKFCNIQTNVKVPKSTIWWGQIYNNERHTGSLVDTNLKTKNLILSIIISFLIIIGLITTNFLIIKKRNRYFATT